MCDKEQQSLKEAKGDVTITTATRTNKPTCTLAISEPSSGRLTDQVIQMLPRPQSTAAECLDQMYTAQHQHILLQTAPLHQQHLHDTQIYNSTQQIAMTTTTVTQPAACTRGAMSQQTLLLGNRSPSANQAQMYLRTQTLIFAPSATESTLQPELTAVTSSQVQSLAFHSNFPGALATPQNVRIEPTSIPSPRMSVLPIKSQNLMETSITTFTPVSSTNLHCPSSQKMAPHQLFIHHTATDQHPVLSAADSNHLTVVSSKTLPDPPPLHLGPALERITQCSPFTCPPPLTLALPRLALPHRLPRCSVLATDVQSNPMVLHKEDLVVLLPSQKPSQPQTAVDLKVKRASQEINLQATRPEDREQDADRESAHDLLDADHPDSSDLNMDNPTAENEQTPDFLQCELCGKRGFDHAFLRSKRFCSLSCARRSKVCCRKQVDVAPRWLHRPLRRRGRPPSRIHGGSREHFVKQQLPNSPHSSENQRSSLSQWSDRTMETVPPSPRDSRQPMERSFQADGEKQESQTSISVSPSQWSVQQVFTFISSLPGCCEIASVFRSQEIDGHALLLLTEDHLMSSMNIKLGPALKICAQINSLKDP